MPMRSNSVKTLTPRAYDDVFTESDVRNEVTLSGKAQAVENANTSAQSDEKVLGVVRGLSAFYEPLSNREISYLETSVFAQTPPNSWEAWFQTVHRAEMGDAFEPTGEDLLTRAGFELLPMQAIDSETVLRAAEVVRLQGDRRSTLAMMMPSNVDGWSWSADPITNRWVCHARFERA